eukprot:PITA_27794
MQVESRKKWEIAMEEEMDSLMHNQTWDLVRLPAGKTTLKNKWVYRLKEEDGGKQRYKARLVVKGFAQKKGIDFDEIFSPVVKMTSIRTILSLVAAEDLHLEQLDVKTAFLHGDLEEEIYMQQPQGYEVKGKEKLVCRLKKSLYGLKQAPRQWYLKFDKFMSEQGYTRCHSDHCVYLKKRNDGSYIILLLYVDDMLVAGSNMQEINVLKRKLANSFAMKELGAAKQILGMRITRDRKNRKLTLSQNERPDIAHAVGVVSRYMNNPGKEHWMAAKWILRYLKGTTDQALCFGGSNISLQGYVDADMAGDRDNRRSTTGYVFTVGGTVVSWVSKIQSVVALSTTEAEYVAATEASKEMIWLQRFMGELSKEHDKGMLYNDSQSAIHLAKNSAFHSRTKHIQLKYHFVRSVLEDGQLKVEKIHTSQNPADMLTKVVTREKLRTCSVSVGLQG